MFGRGYRFRSNDLIMEEIRANAGQANHLFFCDDNFAANPTRAKDLLRRMKEDNFRTSWSTQVRAESAFDTEFLELLRETNCWGVYIGFESASDQVLKAYRKKQDQDAMRPGHIGLPSSWDSYPRDVYGRGRRRHPGNHPGDDSLFH